MGHRDMRQEGKTYSDMEHSLFLNLTCDIGENKRQGHATLSFLKIDTRHWGPPIKGPKLFVSHAVTNRTLDKQWYYTSKAKGVLG